MGKDKLLEVKKLRVTFGSDLGTVTAVDGISFDLLRGESLGIVGESGSGKSVTALSVMRLLAASSTLEAEQLGFHEREGRTLDLLNLPEPDLHTIRGRKIAMIFQEPMTSLNPVFRCGPQVVEGMVKHLQLDIATARQRVLDLFRRVRLPDPERIYEAYPHQLSGGQKQRVMIAMALSCDPEILIADEPTTALDVTVQKAILELIRELQQELGTSIIFISHDLGVIAEIADRVLVMRRGSIVESGRVEDLFRKPRHPYTRGLLACRPPLGHRLRRLPVIEDFLNGDTTGPVAIDDRLKDLRIKPGDTSARLSFLQEQPPLLSVRELNTWFPGRRNFWGKPQAYIKAVDGVSFDVFPGETLGLVGESGCGKTTLGRSVLRLVESRSGEVWFGGKNLMTLSDEELRLLRRDLQIIFQDPYASLNPRMMVGEAIMEPMRQHGLYESEAERREAVMALLETVQLEPAHFFRYPREFSGGQRQRICIARALALKPRFLICDESVSALDVSVQAQVLNLLKDLQEQYGLTYIFISHDLSVVKFMSDRMMVMYEGRILEEGPADEVYAHPQQAYTRRLIEAVPKGKAGM